LSQALHFRLFGLGSVSVPNPLASGRV
jgi:hypothetical protein